MSSSEGRWRTIIKTEPEECNVYLKNVLYTLHKGSKINSILHASVCLVSHTSLEEHLGYEKWALLLGYFGNQLSPKYWLGAFWKNHHFILGDPKKFFWPEKTLFGIVDPDFGGVILLKLFDPSYNFKASQEQKQLFLIFQTSKWLLGSKSFRSITPQS